MKRLIILSAMLAFNAYAGNDVPGNCGQGSGSGNACTGSGGSSNSTASAIGVGVGLGGSGGNASAYGGKGGEGGSAAVVGSGNSSIHNENSNSNLGVNEQGQKQSQSASGYGGTSYGGNVAGNSTSVNFEGSTYKEAAQTAYAPTPQGPRTSCRIFIGFGGSSTSGSLSGGIPLANDALCVAGAQVEFMQTVNKVAPGTFAVGDYLQAVCAVEGMDNMSACQKK